MAATDRAKREVLLEIEGLRTWFHTDEGVAKAVDGVSFSVRKGETLGVVGESGCGKSVTALSVMQLVPMPPGKFEGGRILFRGEDLLTKSGEEMRTVRGNEIAMIFQEPMSALNPVFTAGNQIMETVMLHQGLDKGDARLHAIEMLRKVGIPSPEQRVELQLERDGGRIVRAVTPGSVQEPDPVTSEERTIGRIGVYPAIGELAYREVGLISAVGFGARETVATTVVILGFLGDLFTGGVSPRSVGSIVTIGEASGQAAAAGAQMFLQFIALFSVNLAVLNLLPIPVLDGGHLLFLFIEAVRGKAITVEQRLRWSNVGFLILMGIMIWALSNDFLRLFGL